MAHAQSYKALIRDKKAPKHVPERWEE